MKTTEQKNLNGTRIARPLLAIIVLAGLSIGSFLLVYQQWMNSLFDLVEIQHRQNLTQIVLIARNAVEPVLLKFHSGKISRAEALGQIRTLVRTMTYVDQYGENYVFMSSYDGTMLVQPFEPGKEMTNQWDLKDAHGLFIIRELVKAAQAHPAGSFVRYHYHLPGVHREQEKLAYVVGLPELECYIGTGMYMQRAVQEQMEILRKVQYGGILLLIAVLIPIAASVFFVLNRNRLLLAEIGRRKKVEDELKQSEEKYRSIFENALEGIFQSTTDGRFISVNPAMARILGYESPGEMINSVVSIDQQYYEHPDDRKAYLKALDEKGYVENHLMKIKRKDGSLIWGSNSSRVVRDEKGHILHYEGTLEDITERKRMEKDVQRLAAIVRRTSELVNLCDLDGKMVFLNEAGSKILGIDPGEVAATNIMQVIPEHLRSLVEKELFPKLLAGESWEGDLQYINLKSGKRTDVHTLCFTIDDADAVYQKYMANISLDISQRRQTEALSRHSEEKFSKIFMTTPDGIVITQMADGRFLDANLGFEEITGWRRSEILGRTSLEIKFWADPSHRERLLEELKAGRTALYHEFSFRRKDGTLRTGIYSARSIEIEEKSCIIFIMQDITDRRRLEEERRKLEQQLSRSQKLDAIGQLAGGVAHDFNNILMGIQGNASLMMMECSPRHPHYQRLSRIEEHVKRGANLTRQLLGFAREGKYEVKTLSINELLRKNTQFFIETRKEIEAEFHLQDDLYPVEADAGQIEQVLLNIFINAGHAMPKGGYLHIGTTNVTLEEEDAAAFETKPGDYVRISISDTGTGMDRETLNKIFDPFFTTKAEQGGSGLGLASAYGIIRNHGGAINAASEPGKGSTFNIYLPSSAKKVEKEDQGSDHGLITGSGRILLVDDEPMIVELASDLLQLLGYTVYQAANGPDALSTYRKMQDRIDLVILDMILPGMNGSQVLKMLREINPGIKVILSSGYGLQGEVRKVMETGCQGFIQKPYNFKALSNIVHQVLHPDAGAGTQMREKAGGTP